MSAGEIGEALRNRYARPEFQIEFEVTLSGRRLDAVALGLWPSSKYMLVGFEIKVNRADFIREITNHRKAENWFATVDSFYFVTTPGVIEPSELPAGCGWFEYKNNKLRLKAHPRRDQTKRAEMPREVAARLIARVSERDDAERRQIRLKLRAEVREELLADNAERGEPMARQLADALSDLKDKTERVNQMEAAMGLTPRDWVERQSLMSACRIAAKITTVDVMRREIERSRGLLQRALAQYDEVIADLQTVQAP